MKSAGPTSGGASKAIDLVALALFAGFVACTTLTSIASSSGQVLIVAAAMSCALVIPLIHRIHFRGDISFFLLVPIIISASQNVYLLQVAPTATPSEIQFLVVVNFIFAAATLTILMLLRHNREDFGAEGNKFQRRMLACLAILLAYGLLSAVLFGAQYESAFASLRNLISAPLFLIIGTLAASHARSRTFISYLVTLGVLVFAFGFVERFTPHFWQSTTLANLWELKGLPIAPATGVPPNFYSSETVGGAQLLRMVGSFADPVNFGTFAFCIFMSAWFVRSRLMMGVAVVVTILAVSKGALLGYFVFFVCWARNFGDRTVYWISVVALASAAMLFYLFTLTNSTGSTTAHIEGFTAAFKELPMHPIGRGLGNIGVLASLFSEGSDSGVSESGIGMVVGQLGIIGLVTYASFFTLLLKQTLKIPATRERVLSITLLGSFALNAAFNEVAMSPNSSAPYFIILGLIIGHHHIEMTQATLHSSTNDNNRHLPSGGQS